MAWQAHIQHAPHLYITAAIALGFKAIIIPMALRRMVFRLGIHREIETVVSIGLTMLAGIALVALSLMVMLPVTAHADPVAREDIALALSVVLIGLLMMVTRRNAVSQVAGFLSLENGVNLAATGAQGMPLVVEISVAFSILIAFIVIGIFLFRIRERFDTVDLAGARPVPRRRAAMVRLRSCGSPPDPAGRRRLAGADLPSYRCLGAGSTCAASVAAGCSSPRCCCWSTAPPPASTCWSTT